MTDIAGALSILWPALVAGILVSLSHVPLGQQVLRRGIVFIDLAIAQVAALGVIAAQTAGLELQGWMTQVAAVGAALLDGAVTVTVTEAGALFAPSLSVTTKLTVLAPSARLSVGVAVVAAATTWPFTDH